MIGVAFDKSYFEALDKRDTEGRTLVIQIGPIVIAWYIGCGRCR